MRKFMLVAGTTLAIAGIAVPLTQAAPGAKGKPASTANTGSVACNDGTVTWTPTSIWPPNHKMHTVDIAYSEGENDGDTLAVAVVDIEHDQYIEGVGELVGSGKPNDGADFVPGAPGTATDNGADSAAKTNAQVRAERSGTRQEGRTYTISVQCTDSGDQSGDEAQNQTVEITVAVPHDRRKA